MGDIIITGSAAWPGTTPTPQRSGVGIFTFMDAIDRLAQFAEARGVRSDQAILRASVQSAHLEVMNAHDWPALEKPDRIILRAPQSDGTISYSADTNIFTIAGATWPTWAEDAVVIADDVLSYVKARLSDTQLLADDTMHPAASLGAGTTYRLAPFWYPLPAGFSRFTGLQDGDFWHCGSYLGMTQLWNYAKSSFTTGTPLWYSIGERPGYPGQKALYVYPFSSSTVEQDFVYGMTDRELQFSGYDDNDSVGTITATAESRTITGSGTQFDADMANAILRIGTSGSYRPTGRFGLHRYAEQHVIYSATATTAIQLVTAVNRSRSAVRYAITDPINLEPVVQNALMRYAELHLAQTTGMAKIPEFVALAENALKAAMAATWSVREEPYREAPDPWPIWARS